MTKNNKNSYLKNWKVTALLAVFLIWVSRNEAASWINVAIGLVGVALLVFSLQLWLESKGSNKKK